MNRLLNFGCAFNWIIPAIAFVQDFRNGLVADFGIPAQAGWGKHDIKRLLTRYNIRVWGLMLNSDCDTLMFTVPKTQAKWTYYVLKQDGVPVLYAPVDVVVGYEIEQRPVITHDIPGLLKFLNRFK